MQTTHNSITRSANIEHLMYFCVFSDYLPLIIIEMSREVWIKATGVITGSVSCSNKDTDHSHGQTVKYGGAAVNSTLLNRHSVDPRFDS